MVTLINMEKKINMTVQGVMWYYIICAIMLYLTIFLQGMMVGEHMECQRWLKDFDDGDDELEW